MFAYTVTPSLRSLTKISHLTPMCMPMDQRLWDQLFRCMTEYHKEQERARARAEAVIMGTQKQREASKEAKKLERKFRHVSR